MIRFLFALATILLLHLPVHAKQQGIPVIYSKQVPAEVRKLAPKRSLTVFYGTGRLASPDRVMALHIYKPVAPHKAEATHPAADYILGVFMRESKAGKLQRMNTISFSAVFEFNFVDAEVLWVEPKQRRIPVIHLDLLLQSSDKIMVFSGGQASNNILFNFANGFDKKPTVQDFFNGPSNEHYPSLDLRELDKREYMKLTWWAETEIKSDYEPGVLYWNVDRFVRRKKAHPPIDVSIFLYDTQIDSGVLEKGAITVQLRPFLAQLGATVEYKWGPVEITYNGKRTNLYKDFHNYKQKYGVTPLEEIGNAYTRSTLVHIRYLAETLGFTTQWDPQKRRVTIYP